MKIVNKVLINNYEFKFYYNSIIHTDIDECKQSRHNCPNPSFCVNRHGSFDCECPNGTRLDGLKGCLGLLA